MFYIKKQIVNKIFKFANKNKNIEICGYLAGNDNIVKEIYPMTNIDNSIEHYSFEPKEQFAVLKQTRQQGLNLIAVYHSHPETPARMSNEDIRLANDVDMIYLICSLFEQKIKGFKIYKNKKVKEIKIKVI